MVEEFLWTSGAQADLQAIYNYLEEAQPGTGDALSKAINERGSLLRHFPELGSAYSKRSRRLLVGRPWRYGLFYSWHGTRIVVVAFADLRRDPREIRRILRERGAL